LLIPNSARSMSASNATTSPMTVRIVESSRQSTETEGGGGGVVGEGGGDLDCVSSTS
jgi:hypothetical protein